MSDDKIREEIAEAMSNKVQKGENKFEGTMSDGTKLIMYINNGKIDSAYPIIQ